jgi:hypothetical protein
MNDARGMQSNSKSAPSTSVTDLTTSGKRATGRAVQSTLRCNLGDVLDISSHGLRVKCRKIPTPRTEVVLTDYTRPGQLFAHVIWSKPLGNFHHEVGLKFEKVSKEMATKLKEIAKNPRFRRAA